jgi:DNA-binding transcriptional ArsR family regulator
MMPLGRDADAMARTLKVLANPERLKMLCRMGMADMAESSGESSRPTVGEMVELTGLSQSRVSQHLALLREAGVVQPMREGQVVRYRLIDARIRAVLEALCDLCEAGLPPSRLETMALA